MKSVIAGIAVLMILFSGCVPRDDRGSLKNQIAEKVFVVCENCPTLLSGSYEDDETVDALLSYIRTLGPLSPACGLPRTSDPRQATILFTMSDGSKRVYRQMGNDCLRIDYGPWLQIPAGRGVHLWQLLSDVQKPSDK